MPAKRKDARLHEWTTHDVINLEFDEIRADVTDMFVQLHDQLTRVSKRLEQAQARVTYQVKPYEQ